MSECTLIHITSPRVFMIADLHNFIVKALATSPMIPDAQAAVLELIEYIDKSVIGLFVVAQDQKFVGLMLAENSHSALSPGCSVLHFYNEGGADSRKLLIQSAMAYARSGGFDKIRGFDINQKPAAFARLFKAAGPSKVIGPLIEFDMP